jgi:hypothetical protein
MMAPLIAILTGCTHYYYKPGMTKADFNRDKRDCQRTASQTALRNQTRVCDEIERCLIAKGWSRD